MGDDYQVIARSIRQPMRQWWRHVGVWCVALIVVLLLLLLLDYLFEGSTALKQGIPVRVWVVINLLVAPLCALLWLIAAFRALAALDDLAGASPAHAADSRFLVYRFRLVLSQALWPVLLIAAYSVEYSYYMMVWLSDFPFGPVDWTAVDWFVPLRQISSGLFFLINAMWIAALLVQQPLRRALVWLWWFAAFGFWLVHWIADFSQQLELGSVSYLHTQEISPVINLVLRCSGFVLLMLSVYLIAAGKKPGVILASVMGVIGILGSWKIAVTGSVNLLFAYIGAVPAWKPLFWAGFAEINPANTEVEYLYFDILTIPIDFEAAVWLFWISWPIQAAIAYGYYWFIRRLLVLGASRRAAGT